MRLEQCHNFHDFRKLALKRLPGPIFNSIDGGADDEASLRRNSTSFERCDLVPNVLRDVQDVDLSVGPEACSAILLLPDSAAAPLPSSGRARGRCCGGKTRHFVRRLVGALALLGSEVERGLKLMGCKSVSELSREKLRFRTS